MEEQSLLAASQSPGAELEALPAGSRRIAGEKDSHERESGPEKASAAGLMHTGARALLLMGPPCSPRRQYRIYLQSASDIVCRPKLR